MLNSRPLLHKVKIKIIRNNHGIDCTAIFHSISWPQANATQNVTLDIMPIQTCYAKYQSLCNEPLFSPFRTFLFL